MQSIARIGLVGDFNPKVVAHQAIPVALELAAEAAGLSVESQWVPTEEVQSVARLSGFTGLWCVPASPYRSMEGALRAIRFAREQELPFLGTCGGFQHAVIEYARNVLGWADADHAETAPDAVRAVIAPLECALTEMQGGVRFSPGSRIAGAYGVPAATEGYHCSYGLNPRFQAALVAGPLRATANDDAGEVRAVELDGHPFFVATLFQPERAALQGIVPPLVEAFVRACGTIARPAAPVKAPVKVIETQRLTLRQLSVADAAFMLRLLNEPSFLRYIGDRGVRSLADARTYILKGPVHSYHRFGFGLFMVELKSDGVPIGLCGLVKREFLDDADIGFAFLPEFWSKGYAVESAAAVVDYARDVVGLKRLIAITNQDNAGSIALLRKLGFEFERLITLPGESREINLLATAL